VVFISQTEAYLQIELDEESKKFLVINTHKGLLSSQQIALWCTFSTSNFSTDNGSNPTLPQLPGVVCFINDNIIMGGTEAKHLSNLEAGLATTP
jgi:hypothetical protein